MNQDIESSRDNGESGGESGGQGGDDGIPGDDPMLRIKAAVRAGQVAADVWDDCLTRFLGINRTDGRCIDIIERQGRITPGRLAAESRLTTGAVTVLVDRLEKAGHVRRERDAGDRRRIWISLTPETRETLAHLFAHMRQLGPLLSARYTPEQIAAILEFLAIGARVDVEQAALLEKHLARPRATPGERLRAAEAFRRSAEWQMRGLVRALARGGPFCAPHED